jgi:hypothetical protein
MSRKRSLQEMEKYRVDFLARAAPKEDGRRDSDDDL